VGNAKGRGEGGGTNGCLKKKVKKKNQKHEPNSSQTQAKEIDLKLVGRTHQ
jgi:hypothetical protein